MLHSDFFILYIGRPQTWWRAATVSSINLGPLLFSLFSRGKTNLDCYENFRNEILGEAGGG
jgi:hypothetical protein